MENSTEMPKNWFDNYFIEFNDFSNLNYNDSTSLSLLINMDEYVIINDDDVEIEEGVSYYNLLENNIKKLLYQLKQRFDILYYHLFIAHDAEDWINSFSIIINNDNNNNNDIINDDDETISSGSESSMTS